MGVSKPNSGSFSKGHQPQRRRGKSSKTYLLEAMKSQGLTQVDIWKHTLNLALKEDDSAALNLIVNRLFPALKPVSELLPEGLLPTGWLELSRTSRLNYLIMLVISGKVHIDTCVSLAKVMESAATVETTDQLDLLLDSQVILGDGDRKTIDRLKFAQDLSDRVNNTVQADRQRLKDVLTDELDDDSASDTNTEPDTNTTDTIEDSIDE